MSSSSSSSSFLVFLAVSGLQELGFLVSATQAKTTSFGLFGTLNNVILAFFIFFKPILK